MGSFDERAMLAVRLVMPDGSLLEREWSYEDAMTGRLPALGGPPKWLKNPKRSWERPQDPIVVQGQVRAGHEDDARRWVGG